MQKVKASILIVDDDKDILTSLSLYLKHHFEKVETSLNPKNLTGLLNDHDFDCVVLDMNFRKGVNDGKEGLYWLKYIKDTRPDTSVVLLTAYGNLEVAVEALKIGASDFMVKPWKNEKLLSTLMRSLELQRSKKEIKRLQNVNKQLSRELNGSSTSIETRSTKMRELLEVAEKVAKTDANVLILGENGSGKEVLARSIHQMSERRAKSFIKVDLGSINPNLIESELFGHKKGAFTDAKSDRIGRFEMAKGGSIFLDEIGNLSLENQSKLLSVLQNRIVTPLGSNKEIELDTRLICATNSNLAEEINEQNFRQDLFYRINTVELYIPPLRERKEDIVMMGQKFLDIYRNKYNKPKLKLSSKALSKLEDHNWPGNVRELMHTIERLVVLNDKEILAEQIQLPGASSENDNLALPSLKLEEVEKFCIIQALSKNMGNISHTAKELDINRNTLYRKMEKYGL